MGDCRGVRTLRFSCWVRCGGATWVAICACARAEARGSQITPEGARDTRGRQETPEHARRRQERLRFASWVHCGRAPCVAICACPRKEARTSQIAPEDAWRPRARRGATEDATGCQKMPGKTRNLVPDPQIIGHVSQNLQFLAKIEVCALKPRILLHTSACEDRDAPARLFRV